MPSVEQAGVLARAWLAEQDVRRVISQSQELEARALEVAAVVHNFRNPGWVTDFPFAVVEWNDDHQEEREPYTTVCVAWDESVRGSVQNYSLSYPIEYLWLDLDTIIDMEHARDQAIKAASIEKERVEREARVAAEDARDRATYERLKARFET